MTERPSSRPSSASVQVGAKKNLQRLGYRRIVKLLVTESERLSKLIERLLDWGRMEAGRKLYELRVESPRSIVEDAVRAVDGQRHLAKAQKDELQVDVASDLPDVLVDRAAMAD